MSQLTTTADSAASPAVPSGPPDRGRPALVILVGAPGSGKSYLGRLIAADLGAEHIQTDVVRKELFPRPRYTPGEAEAVYAVCRRRARMALERGVRVVFDGTNLRERRRASLYRLAEQAGARLVVVVAYAPEAVIRERLARRAAARDPAEASDADWSVYLKLRDEAEPVGVPHVVANTEAGAGPVLRVVRRLLD